MIRTHCKHCEEALVNAEQGRPRVFCGDVCKNAYHEKRRLRKNELRRKNLPMRTCSICPTEFKPRTENGKYCSKACSNRATVIYKAKQRAKKNGVPYQEPMNAEQLEAHYEQLARDKFEAQQQQLKHEKVGVFYLFDMQKVSRKVDTTPSGHRDKYNTEGNNIYLGVEGFDVGGMEDSLFDQSY